MQAEQRLNANCISVLRSALLFILSALFSIPRKISKIKMSFHFVFDSKSEEKKYLKKAVKEKKMCFFSRAEQMRWLVECIVCRRNDLDGVWTQCDASKSKNDFSQFVDLQCERTTAAPPHRRRWRRDACGGASEPNGGAAKSVRQKPGAHQALFECACKSEPSEKSGNFFPILLVRRGTR